MRTRLLTFWSWLEAVVQAQMSGAAVVREVIEPPQELLVVAHPQNHL
jgi:hypothetical protein